MIAAEWGTGQVLWSMLWFFMFVIWIWMILRDLQRHHRQPGPVGWGPRPSGRSSSSFCRSWASSPTSSREAAGWPGVPRRQTQDANQATQAYIREAAAASTDADRLADLAVMHSAGKIDDAEYATAKARIIG